jgi:hypothetical protein
MRFRPLLQNSRGNPFLREHLSLDEILRLERASVIRQYMWPTAALLLGICLGMSDSLIVLVSPWVILALAGCLLYFALRSSEQIDAAWHKALENHETAISRKVQNHD